MNVIIVDDEAIVRHGIRHSVNWAELGVERVEEAAHGREVLDKWEEWRPDLIVTDIKMPVMDGIELIKEARKRDSECICIVLSCAEEFELVKEALLVGAADYLLKMTVRPEELMTCMRKMTEDYRSRARAVKAAGISEGERRTAFFRQLFSGRYHPEEVEIIAEQCGLRGMLDLFVLAVLQVKGTGKARGRGEVKQNEGWYEIADWLAGKERKHHFVSHHIDGNEFVLLLTLRPVSEQADPAVDYGERYLYNVKEQLMDLLAGCSEQMNIEVRCGTSSISSGLSKLHRAYVEARLAAREHLFLQPSPILCYPERQEEPPVRESMDIRSQFDHSFRQRLMQALLTGSLEEAEQTIDHYFSLLSGGRCSAEAAHDCIDKTVAILNVAAMEISCLAGWSEYQLVEDFEGEPFPLYWKITDTAGYAKRYCRYLFANRQARQHRGDRNVVQQIRTYMHEHYQTKITLEQMAAQFFLNKNYLSQLFKTETGINFTRYLNAIRIDKAKELMLHTTLTIQEIAESTGFGDFRYFSRVFRSHTGQSPTEFKASKKRI